MLCEQLPAREHSRVRMEWSTDPESVPCHLHIEDTLVDPHALEHDEASRPLPKRSRRSSVEVE